ncbi:MAG: hypothetical protein R3B13_06760 [Polyangiaceae bacterium]
MLTGASILSTYALPQPHEQPSRALGIGDEVALAAWFGATRTKGGDARPPRRERAASQTPGWLHGYVSADPTVAVAGTPPPQLAEPTPVSRAPLADLVAAVRASTPWSSLALKRRVFVTLAGTVGWRDTMENALAIGVHPQTIRRLRRSPVAPRVLTAALLCLGDARLRT